MDNQGKVRCVLSFPVPLAAGTQPRRHGLPARRFVPEKTICADVGLHGMDIHLGGFMHRHRAPIGVRKALRCGQSLSARPSRTAYLSRCLAWRYRHAPGRSVHASQPGKRFIHKPGRDSAKRAVADPGLRRYRPGGALAFGSQGVPTASTRTPSMEIVANLAVWLGGECHVGQMIDWFGDYDRTSGARCSATLRKPANGARRGFPRSPPSAARAPVVIHRYAGKQQRLNLSRLSIFPFFLPGCGPAAAGLFA